jgi:hypothetical protein
MITQGRHCFGMVSTNTNESIINAELEELRGGDMCSSISKSKVRQPVPVKFTSTLSNEIASELADL